MTGRRTKDTGTMEGLIIGAAWIAIIYGLVSIWPDIEDVINDLNDQGRG